MKDPLWIPQEEKIHQSNVMAFMYYLSQRHRKTFLDYFSLYEWSIENPEQFWSDLWHYAGIKAREPFERVLVDGKKMPGARWFVGSQINFAENLLSHRDERKALISWGEKGKREELTYHELYEKTSSLVESLKKWGLQSGDRVAAFMPNIPETIIAMLSATSLGAIWSSCSPDFGFQGILDRFGQISPRLLFTTDGYYFKGKWVDVQEKLIQLVEKIPSLEKVVVVPFEKNRPDVSALPKAVLYEDFLSQEYPSEIPFVYHGFDHPVYIMYSSGTTGLPKCIVQGPGVLMGHLKELLLHCNLKREDKIFYFTTCGWMMWHWLVSSLAVGATIVLYEGNPFYPDPLALWKMAEIEKLTILGTSAGYLHALRDTGEKPSSLDLSSLEMVLSTGSPLSPEGFSFVYESIKKDVQLSSISGGTDLNGCFALGCPILPVYSGELQVRGLGMKVEIFDEEGRSIQGKTGELVCSAPFPSMPLYFWNDPEGKKYHEAYFNVYPNVWRHGDFAEITERGGMIFYGRSDATLNPGGVRIGTAEIYRIIEEMEEIEDSVAVGQPWQKDERVILFVKMKGGKNLDEEIRKKIRDTIKNKISPRHVPAKIVAVKDIPYTINMKKVEVAIKQILQGREVKNRDALKNPESLEGFKNLMELKE